MVSNMINSSFNSAYFLPQNTVNNIAMKNRNSYGNQPVQNNINNSETPKKKGVVGWIAGASAVTLIAGVALLFKFSPKFVSKNVAKLKKYFDKKLSGTLANSKTRKFYTKAIATLNWTADKVNCANNFNNLKDIGYARLCKAKIFGGEKSPLVKINNKITKFFKKMAQNTVYRNYHSADRNYNELIDMVMAQKSKFTPSEWVVIEKNISELQNLINNGFSNKAISNRLRQQNALMENLDKKVLDKTKLLFDNNYYRQHNLRDNALYVDNHLKFFSEDILAKDKEAYGKIVNALEESITNQARSGKVQELLTALKGKLPKDEYNKLVAQAESADKALNKAVSSETGKYFDKVRDLNLGGAPTDIVTVLGSSAIAGTIIAKANDKDEKISKSLTKGIPIVGTIGTSLLLSANLVAGTKALILAGLSGIAMSKLGELIDHSRIKNKDKQAAKLQKLIDTEIKKRSFMA